MKAPEHCESCGAVAELRPYGKDGAWICFPCGHATPEATAETEQRMKAAIEAAGPVPVFRVGGPPVPLADVMREQHSRRGAS